MELSQTVALKFLPESFAKNKDALARFRGEVRNARQVSHPNVCKVFDIGETGGAYYLSMEYVDGDDPSMLLRRIGRFPSDKAVEISRQICLGLHAIHEAGILHRDLKPANIIIDSRGKARITDFGIAGIEQDLIGKKEIVGTPAYMSPEQITGKEITQKSDIYSLGLLLYEIFTGKQTFQADSVSELINIHTSVAPTNPSKFLESIDPLVERVINRCLEKNPADRPKSALQVALSLPGGNPLEAAIAAGETPSPEMIAAIPKKGALKPKVALLFMFLILAGFILSTVRNQYVAAYSLTPLKKSPEILAERAKVIVSDLGYAAEDVADAKYRFWKDSGFLNYLTENKSITNPRERLRAGQPLTIYFIYRQSPNTLAPWDNVRITETDPPLNVAGMINVRLDARGRLIGFLAVPNQIIQKMTAPPTTDWTKLFDAAGLDIKNFETTEPQKILTVAADTQTAWQGTLADFPDIPIRIEAAALNGKPVYFQIVYPWDKAAGNKQLAGGTSSNLPTIIVLLIGISVLIGAILLVRHNLKVGRSDIKGSLKLTLVCFLGLTFSELTGANHFSDLDGEMHIFYLSLSFSLYLAIIIGLLYLALEPYARRYFPELLISWNRLLAGDFRDPMIGRDILIGGLAAIASVLVYQIAQLTGEYLLGAGEYVRNNYNSGVLNGWSQVISEFFGIVLDPLRTGLGSLFVFLLFYIIFRNKKISAGLVFLLFSLPVFVVKLQGGDWTEFILGILYNLFFVFVLVRFGLLAAIFFPVYLLFAVWIPITYDASSFLFPGTTITFIAAFALTIYGFYTSTAGQPLFKGGFLDEGKKTE